MVRKVGGFTFQELNLTVDDIKVTSEAGADLSYDFINRPPTTTRSRPRTPSSCG